MSHRLPAALAAILAALLAPASPAGASPRTALIEVFGAPDCLPCLQARAAAATVAAENDSLVTWTEYHVGTASPLGGLAQDIRAQSYGSPSLPAIFVDGTPLIPSGAGLEKDLRNAVTASLAAPAPLELKATFAFEPISGLGSVLFDLTATENIPEVSHDDIRVVILEDPMDWCCGVNNESVWPRVARLLLAPIPLAAMNSGDQQSSEVFFDLDPSWNPDNLHGLVFVQRISDRAVLQAVEGRNAGTLPPLPPTPDDPDVITLFPNRPNPARGFVRVEFFLPHPAWAKVRILDVHGALVRQLTEGQRTAGSHPLNWDGTDARGRRQGAGVYFVVLETSTVRKTKRLTLLP
jgi:hypothetical protein